MLSYPVLAVDDADADDVVRVTRFTVVGFGMLAAAAFLVFLL